jgi:serine/threonine protein kinase
MLNELLLDRYRILEVLGTGGMGQAYIAEDIQRPGNPKCVVKCLKPMNGDPAFSVMAQRLFIGEAEALEKLGKHDQISQLLACFERDGEFYLVQEYIDGHTLNSELPLGQRWSEQQVVAMLKDVLPILGFIHDRGIIHRDIKPDNIVRRKQDGKLVLIDFGAVKQIQMQQTSGGQGSMTVAIGTPGYMPTEQSSGKPRFNSDIYALGMISIQALTGLLPSQLKEDEDGEVIWRDQAEVSNELMAVINMMTRHYFKNRYQSAEEVLHVLEALNGQEQSLVNYTPTQVAPTSNHKSLSTPAESTQVNSNQLDPKSIPSSISDNGENHGQHLSSEEHQSSFAVKHTSLFFLLKWVFITSLINAIGSYLIINALMFESIVGEEINLWAILIPRLILCAFYALILSIPQYFILRPFGVKMKRWVIISAMIYIVVFIARLYSELVLKTPLPLVLTGVLVGCTQYFFLFKPLLLESGKIILPLANIVSFVAMFYVESQIDFQRTLEGGWVSLILAWLFSGALMGLITGISLVYLKLLAPSTGQIK